MKGETYDGFYVTRRVKSSSVLASSAVNRVNPLHINIRKVGVISYGSSLHPFDQLHKCACFIFGRVVMA